MAAFQSDLSEAFNLMLGAPSRTAVEKCLHLTFLSLNEPSPQVLAQALAEILSIQDSQAALQLGAALTECVLEALRAGSIEVLGPYFAERSPTLDKSLRTLLGKTVQANLLNWSSAGNATRVSLPKLVGHSWAVHQQSASSAVSSMQVPAVLVRIKVQDQPSEVGKMPEVRNEDLELSREALETMLEGFGRIRDQLSSFK